MLTGEEILKEVEKGNIIIKPFNKERINPNSYNLSLDSELKIYKNKVLDARMVNETKTIIIPEEGYVLEPGELYLARTVEYTETHKLVPVLSGRSSIGRLGIMVHVTAGFGDVGFKGTWTLEIMVAKPVRIYPNMQICQIYYHPIVGTDGIQYKGKYQDQKDVTASRLHSEYVKTQVMNCTPLSRHQ